METVAIYYEHPVRTYGLKVEEGFCLLSVSLPAPALEEASSAMAGLDPPVALAFAALHEQPEGPRAVLCFPQAQEQAVRACLEDSGAPPDAPARSVSLVHIQGPHFGDRYGLASLVVQGLTEAGVEPLAFTGVVHSLFLALRPQDAQRALAGLGRHFCQPG